MSHNSTISPSDGSESKPTSSHSDLDTKSGRRESFELHTADAEQATVPRPRIPWSKRTGTRFASRSSQIHPSLARIVNYLKGPKPPVELPDPSPFLDVDLTLKGRRVNIPLESALKRFTRPFTHPWLLLLLGAAYIVGLAFLSRAQSFLTPASAFIDCTSTYWAANNACGLNGEECGPFSESMFDFRCPGQCSSVILQNPRTVGNEQIAFKPLIVGGGDSNVTYRGDSFICAAATHAGLINPAKGGCGTLQLVTNFTNFIPATNHGLASIGFTTVFPIGFRFFDSTSLSHCEDIRNPVLAFNVIITCLLFLLLRPKPIVLYWCLVCIGFWHIALFSQPQGTPPALSIDFGIFLPTLFIAYALWRLAFRFTLPAFEKAQVEATIWYLGPFWVGVLTNLTTAEIPISRLLASDIRQREGGVASLVVIVIVVLAVAINQLRVMRKTGWLPHYVGWYVLGGLVTLVISQLPGLQLRLHHYIIALVALPGTGFPTRISAILQGFLLGTFLNGVAAFGYDSILQTAQEVSICFGQGVNLSFNIALFHQLRQDATLGSDLPIILTNASNWNISIPLVNQSISWDALPSGWDSFSLLVDDVERYAGTALNYSLAALDPSLPHFFRLALVSSDQTGDFTMAASVWPNGTWVDQLPGPSF
ncbi:hypothetical protein HGRIS_008085 [Hohenbuehelia grisea]|uniref:LCCL domain-containing protein n=1 Tax=Hohenbuehelia grisea TaxID=104357 RepID=A0ABR3J6W4_9AGAR